MTDCAFDIIYKGKTWRDCTITPEFADNFWCSKGGLESGEVYFPETSEIIDYITTVGLTRNFILQIINNITITDGNEDIIKIIKAIVTRPIEERVKCLKYLNNQWFNQFYYTEEEQGYIKLPEFNEEYIIEYSKQYVKRLCEDIDTLKDLFSGLRKMTEEYNKFFASSDLASLWSIWQPANPYDKSPEHLLQLAEVYSGVAYERDGDNIIAYKGVTAQGHAITTSRVQYTSGNYYEEYCCCDLDEEAGFGISVWDKNGAEIYADIDGKVLTVLVNKFDIGYINLRDGVIRAKKIFVK